MSPSETLRNAIATSALLLVLGSAPALAQSDGGVGAGEKKVLHLPIRSAGPGSLDPVTGSTQYDNQACSYVYEPLLQYKYLVRPLDLEPLLLTRMPEASADGLTWTFELRKDVRFADDACFPDGKGRALVADDVFYSWKRLADGKHAYENWWLLEGTIAGFDRFKEEQNRPGATFDYDAPVDGLQKIDDHHFRVVLTKPVQRFKYVLAMFQTSIVPREAVEHYGTRFNLHPVGTGPFLLDEWRPNESISFDRNPSYHPDFYPTEFMPEDEALGLNADAGKRLPFVDRVEITFFIEEQPMWLQFEDGNLDYTQVHAEKVDSVINKRKRKLEKEYSDRGIRYAPLKLYDFIFRGFNMEDELLGGYTAEKIKLRAAISLAIDLDEFNETFYNGINIVYDGPIPPGLDGSPGEGEEVNPYRGPDLDRAKQLLAEAGYPDGKGLPVIEYYTSNEGNSPEQGELMKRQLAGIGVELNVRLILFPQLIEAINKKKAQFFSFAWGSDYPDGENNLALFYGPNVSPGSNHFNYQSAEFDQLYRQILTMAPGPERTAVYERMRDMVIADVPYVGSMTRIRHYVAYPWLRNFKPEEVFHNWPKYLDLGERP